MTGDSRDPRSSPAALDLALNEMADAQLVRRSEESAGAFVFKHALVQDTVYTSLLRHDRKRLHGLVADTLERTSPDRTDELAPILAGHFDEAGNSERALFYYQRAAENAAARYANLEALDFYTRALDAAESLETDTRDSLHRARGQVHERIGNFDAARVDLEKALEIAREQGDSLAEWQSLMDLGFAWLARDYARAGEYFEKGLELARASNDETRVAYTLNRVGNWYLNSEDIDRALTYQREALGVFEHLGNGHAVAETQDLLGMTNLVGGDPLAARRHFSAALELFDREGDMRGYLTSYMSNLLPGTTMQGDTVVLLPPPDMEASLGEIVRLSRQVGWRAGEAFGLWVAGNGFAALGKYDRSLELIRQALQVAREIDHRQWLSAATMVLGRVHADILNPETARRHLENALVLAREVGSAHWVRTSSGLLGSTCIVLGDLTRAEHVLDAALPPGTPARTLGQRQAWAARVELALARKNPAQALEWLELLWRQTSNMDADVVIPHLWCLRARALLLLDQLHDAEMLLLAAVRAARAAGQSPMEWRALCLLAQTYRLQRRSGEARRQEDSALEIVGTLANTIPDSGLRANFVSRAGAMVRGD